MSEGVVSKLDQSWRGVLPQLFLGLLFAGLFLGLQPAALLPALGVMVLGLWTIGDAQFSYRHLMQFSRGGRWVLWALLAWPLSEYVSNALAWGWGDLEKFRVPDNSLRFVFAVPLALVFYRYSFRLRNFSLGLVFAAVAAFLWAAYGSLYLGEARVSGALSNPIYFGNLALVVAVFLWLMAVSYQPLHSAWRYCYGFCGGLAFVACVFSGTRSCFLAVLVWAIALLWLQRRSILAAMNWRHISLIFLTILLAIVAMTQVPSLSQKLRLSETQHELEAIGGGSGLSSASMASRISMWQAGGILFASEPIWGIGSKGYQNALKDLQMSARVAKVDGFDQGIYMNQAHNDLIHALATGGLIRGVAYCLVIGLPLLYFYRRWRSATSAKLRLLSLMGLSHSGLFLVFGLTLATFSVQIYSLMYPIIVAVLLGAIERLLPQKE